MKKMGHAKTAGAEEAVCYRSLDVQLTVTTFS
jgi:hypothetical protein